MKPWATGDIFLAVGFVEKDPAVKESLCRTLIPRENNMPPWMLKAAIQSCIARLPRNYVWNELFQQHVTRTLRLDDSQFRYKLVECREMIESYLAAAPGRMLFTKVLELGTGWYPILPLGFYLCGASRIWTFDIYPLLRIERATRAVRSLVEFAECGALQEVLPWGRPDRLDALTRLLNGRRWPSATHMLAEVGIHVRVRDARSTELEASSIDFVMSNGTLQHIPVDVLRQIFMEFRRVASPDAVMSHLIVLADHFRTFDPSITPFNYLKYPASQWRWINNPLIFQNRLRLSDYRTIHREAGFEVVGERNITGSPVDLDRLRLAPEFQRYDRDDLLVIRSCIMARPAAASLPNSIHQ